MENLVKFWSEHVANYKTTAAKKGVLTREINRLKKEIDFICKDYSKYYMGELTVNVLDDIKKEIKAMETVKEDLNKPSSEEIIELANDILDDFESETTDELNLFVHLNSLLKIADIQESATVLMMLSFIDEEKPKPELKTEYRELWNRVNSLKLKGMGILTNGSNEFQVVASSKYIIIGTIDEKNAFKPTHLRHIDKSISMNENIDKALNAMGVNYHE